MILSIKVVPKSSKDQISWYDKTQNIIKLNLRAPAVEGKANKNLIDFLSDFFKLKKEQIKIKSGETSKLKRVELSAEEVSIIEKLKFLD